YTAPLGVGFMVRPGHHYGPDVDGYEYTPWGTYHFADRDGIGVDRTVATGTGFAGLFPEPWASRYEDASTCPDELLLFFHHVPYTHRLHSGKTVIQHIYDSRADGYEKVLTLRPRWQELAGCVPSALHERVDELLRAQERSAEEWRDQLRTYFFRAPGVPAAAGRPSIWARWPRARRFDVHRVHSAAGALAAGGTDPELLPSPPLQLQAVHSEPAVSRQQLLPHRSVVEI